MRPPISKTSEVAHRILVVPLCVTLLAFLSCTKKEDWSQTADDAGRHTPSPTQTAPSPSGASPPAPLVEREDPVYQQAAAFVSAAVRDRQVADLRALEQDVKERHLAPDIEKAIVRVLESMEEVVGPGKAKPPIRGKYATELRAQLLPLALATYSTATNEADALAKQLQHQLETSILRGPEWDLNGKAAALRNMASKRGIHGVDGILAMPEAQTLPQDEREALRAVLHSYEETDKLRSRPPTREDCTTIKGNMGEEQYILTLNSEGLAYRQQGSKTEAAIPWTAVAQWKCMDAIVQCLWVHWSNDTDPSAARDQYFSLCFDGKEDCSRVARCSREFAASKELQ